MSKKISENILKYTAVFEPCEEGGFTVTVPKLPGLVTEGDTYEEALEMVKDAISGYLKVLNEQGEEIPEPDNETFTTNVGVKMGNIRFAV